MACYLTLVDTRIEKLDGWSIWQAPQEENERVDALAKVVVTLPIQETMMLSVYLQVMASISLKWVNKIH